MGFLGAIGAVVSGALSGGKVKRGLTTAGMDVHTGLTVAGREVAAEIRHASVRLAEAALEASHIHGKYIAASVAETNKNLKEISDEWRTDMNCQLKRIREDAKEAIEFGFSIVACAVLLHPFLDAEVKGYTSVMRALGSGLASYGALLLGDTSALRSAALSLISSGALFWTMYSIADLRYTAMCQMVLLDAGREETEQLKLQMSQPKRYVVVGGHGENGGNKIAERPGMQWNIQNLNEICSSNFANGALELLDNQLVVKAEGAGQYNVRASVPGWWCQYFQARVYITDSTNTQRQVINGTLEYEGRGGGDANSSVRSHVAGLVALQEGDKVGVYAKISAGNYTGAGYKNPAFVAVFAQLELQEL